MGKTGSSAGGGWVAAWRGHKTVLIHVVGKAAPDTRLAAVVRGQTNDEPERATARRQTMGTLRSFVLRVL